MRIRQSRCGTSGMFFPRASSCGSSLTIPCRFVGEGLGLVLVIILQGISLWAFFFLPRVRRKDAALLMFGVGLLLVRLCLSINSLLSIDLFTAAITLDLPPRGGLKHHILAALHGPRVAQHAAR